MPTQVKTVIVEAWGYQTSNMNENEDRGLCGSGTDCGTDLGLTTSGYTNPPREPFGVKPEVF